MGTKVPPPRRRRNKDVRSREWLSETEVQAMIKEAKKRFLGHRDYLLIETTYKHALRPSEALYLRWDDLDLINKTMTIRRFKTDKVDVHTLEDDEVYWLKRWKHEQRHRRRYPESIFVFPNKSGDVMSMNTFSRMLKEIGKVVGIKEDIHPYMLRHSKGYELARNGAPLRLIAQYFSHNKIQTTMRYTNTDPLATQGFSKLSTKGMFQPDNER